MDALIIFLTVLQGTAISLGMGGSTFAILNFFAAIADGVISEEERNLMGIVYTVLRIVMVVILITAAALAIDGYLTSEKAYFTPYILAIWTLIIVLYSNAFLMTKRIMPSTIGPALQASTWYTLGIFGAFYSLRLTDFTYMQFILSYFAFIIFAVALVNGVMAYLKEQRKSGVQAD